jgi:hypothetical protein
MWQGRGEEIEALRATVLGHDTREARRAEILRTQLLLGPPGQRCCTKWLKNVFGVRSNDKLYGRTSEARERKDEKRLAIIAWFQDLVQTADKMPDSNIYIIPAPSRKGVWKWYCGDGEAYPTLFPPVTRAYFLMVWAEYFPTVKLRKYLRFTKCCTCVKWRTVRWSKTASAEEKAVAMTKLKEHYDYIKQERAYARLKRNHAWTHPSEVMSVAIDGCENLAHGIPHFPEISKADSGVRLKYHCVVGIVHGAPQSYVYVGRENVYHDPNLTIEVLQRLFTSEEIRRGAALPGHCTCRWTTALVRTKTPPCPPTSPGW